MRLAAAATGRSTGPPGIDVMGLGIVECHEFCKGQEGKGKPETAVCLCNDAVFGRKLKERLMLGIVVGMEFDLTDIVRWGQL
jgi:hypothetical protein